MPGKPVNPGRPNLVGRIQAAIAAGAGRDVRAVLRSTFDDDDRTNVASHAEDAWRSGARPLDAVQAAYGVDADTAAAMIRESI